MQSDNYLKPFVVINCPHRALSAAQLEAMTETNT
jgi:hypothetical protein